MAAGPDDIRGLMPQEFVLAADISAHEFRLSAESAQFSGECLPSIVA
jgi:hypothetical protein